VSTAQPAMGSLERVGGAAGMAAEDYLVGIAALAEGGERVLGAQLARLLGVSPPSVTQMMRRLAAAQLVVSGGSNGSLGITLTAHGQAIARWLLARRRVCECFFVDALGLDWPTALRAADRMEHGLSQGAVRQLHQALGAPTTCPHGNRLDLLDPNELSVPGAPAAAADTASVSELCMNCSLGLGIVDTPPAANASGLPSTRAGAALSPLLSLATAPAGARVIVERLLGPAEQDAATLAYLSGEGIKPGQALIVEGTMPAGDLVAVRRARRRHIMPARLAAAVEVRLRPASRRKAAVPAARTLPPPCRPSGCVRLTAVRVDGPCASGHVAGEHFFLGTKTPAGLCGASYAALLPAVQRLLVAQAAGQTPPALVRRCPGDGYVLWRLELDEGGDQQATV